MGFLIIRRDGEKGHGGHLVVSATQLCICPFLSQFTEESGNWIRKKRKERERSGAHNQSPEPVSKCVSVCVRVGIATICETFRVKIRTVPGKQGQLVQRKCAQAFVCEPGVVRLEISGQCSLRCCQGNPETPTRPSRGSVSSGYFSSRLKCVPVSLSSLTGIQGFFQRLCDVTLHPIGHKNESRGSSCLLFC